MDDFDALLADFQDFANSVDPSFAANVNNIIAVNYVSRLGEASAETKATTADKLSSFVDNMAGAYLKSVEAYYLAKQKVADLQMAARGSAATQLINAAQSGAQYATGINPIWYIGAAALLGVVLLSRK